MQYQGPQVFRRLVPIVLATFFLVGCESQSDEGSSEGLISSAEVPISGSVGDGPVTGADIRVLDRRGRQIATTAGSASATYNLVVPAGSEFPITIEASGGTDLVTGRALDFTLRTVVPDPEHERVNLTPLNTLASDIARCTTDSVQTETLSDALATLQQHLGRAVDPARVADPLHGTIDASNIADVVLANEALGEVIRRTHNALQASSAAATPDTAIGRLACDLADGGGVNGSNTVAGRTMAAFHGAFASVALELIAGKLHVDGADATSLMNASLTTVMPGTTRMVGSVPIDGSVATQAAKSLAVLGTVFADPELNQFRLLLEQTPPANLRSAVASALNASAMNTFDGLAQRAALADDTELATMKAAATEVTTAPAPNLSFAASPTTVNSGQTAILSWASTDATSCLASGAWSGARAVEGTFTTNALTAPATYQLACTGLGGTVTRAVTVNVQSAPAAPQVTITANPTQVNSGGSSTLTWTSSNATGCTASGAWSGSRGVNGSASVGPLSANSTFTLTCTGAGGSASASAMVSVAAAPPPPMPTVTLTANPNSVAFNGSTTLNWSSTNATSCTASGDWTGSRATSGSTTQSNLTANRSYTLTCTGSGGSAAATATVTVGAPPPTVTLTANPASVAYNGSTTLSWSSSNANSCTASGDWSGSRATSGSSTQSSLTANRTYTLTCSGAGGSASSTATVTVAPPQPTVTLTANPTSVAYDGSSTLSWSSTNATSCTASGDWSGSRATSGSATQSNLTASRTYTLTCTGAGGSGSATATVAVAAAPPTVTLTANPTSVANNGSTTLTWSSTNATSCTASGDWSGSRATSGSATQSNLTANRTYTLTCTGTGGSNSATANVTVAAAPPTVTLTANPTSVAYNGSTSLSWSSTNATSCTASGDWSGSRATTGSSTQSNLTANRTYTLTCTGTGGSNSATANVTVAAAAAPTLTLSASPTSVAYNGSTTLSWSSTNATSCTASGGWTGAKSVSGSEVRSSLTANATFTLDCTGAGGSATQSVNVTVAPASPTVTLTASPAWVAPNGSSTLSWTSSNVTACTASGGWSGTKATSGSEGTGAMTQDRTYTLTCTGPSGSAVSMASVNIRRATLSWQAPTQNVDGSPLTNLAGYTVHYGNSSRNYTQSLTVNGATNTQAVITLSPGTWYFGVTARNTDGGVSSYSNEVSKQIN